MRGLKASILALLLCACGGGTTSASGGDTDTDSAGGSEGDSSGLGTSAGCDAPLGLSCPAPVTAECTAPQSAVELTSPELACADWSLTDDRLMGYPVGASVVTFVVDGDGMQRECTTEITLEDTTAPSLMCPSPQTIIRQAADQQLMAPTALASDLCDATVEAAPVAAELGPGTNTVQYVATDASGNSGMCSTQIEVVDAFAAPGFRLISATLTGEGDTEITLAWEPAATGAVTAYRIESAEQAGGPWVEVTTVDDTTQLFTETLTLLTQHYRVVSVTEVGDGGVTSSRQAFAVAAEQYDIRNVAVPGINFLTTVYGVVRQPSDLGLGPFPLVVVLHGNHGNCRDPQNPDVDYCSTSQDHECGFGGGATTPNAEGYIYFLDTLAAQGYIAVSISGNAMNCRSDYIPERAALIAEHLRRFSTWQSGSGVGGGQYQGTLDLSRVGLVGHSRGGDAVSHVPALLAQNPIAGLAVTSVFAVAPTDYHDVELRDTNLAVLLPSCDGDVATLAGLNHYDRSTAFDDGVEQAQVLYIGANHNFFNSQWRVSEWESQPFNVHPACDPAPEQLKPQQRRMLEATLGSWFASTLQGQQETEAFVRADEPSPSAFDAWAQTELDLRWSYSAVDRVTIDDFANTLLLNNLGGDNAFLSYLQWNLCGPGTCSNAYVHLKNAVRLLWEQGNEPQAQWELGGYDASDAVALSLRVTSRTSSLNTGLEEQDFLIRIYDSLGVVAALRVSDLKTLNHQYPQLQSARKDVFETVRIPISKLLEIEPTLDVSSLQTLEFEMTALDRSGSVIVTDLEFVR